MANVFSNILTNKPKKSKFDLSHERKMSLQMGKLYPTLLQEVVPGDSFRGNSEILLRLAPMLAPVMHRVNVYMHYYFVPNRLVWDEWEDFITGGEDGQSQPPFPVITNTELDASLIRKGSLADYMGLPIAGPEDEIGGEAIAFSALPFRAYQTIYNEYYRDQNLIPKVETLKTSGELDFEEIENIMLLRTRAWEKDYFTSALPWAQRGGEAEIPLGTVEPNYKTQTELTLPSGTPVDGNLEVVNGTLATITPGQTINVENLDTMNVESTTINDLRKANKLQEWLEKSARGGARYIETILSHFGVRSRDARLQRPEYLGGGRQPVIISEVLQTSSTDATSPQGEMAGHGISVGSKNRFSGNFTEHGHIIGIMSVIPKTAYQQGMDRLWTKFDKFDHYWPSFANLGEQEVKNKELFVDWANVQNSEVTFGYQQRYAEYKYQSSKVAGDFREDLDFWAMTRIFSSQPELGQGFVEADPTKRIFAVTDGNIDELYCQIYHNISAIRPMPYFSIPSLT